ncbi:hypothetical protein GBW32_08300 [Streptomyces tsukubensis]|nr:hypothetical protein GBW32_08300 [Streptomyces tsukubensis]
MRADRPEGKAGAGTGLVLAPAFRPTVSPRAARGRGGAGLGVRSRVLGTGICQGPRTWVPAHPRTPAPPHPRTPAPPHPRTPAPPHPRTGICQISRISKVSRTNSAVPSSPVLRRPTHASPLSGAVKS